MVDVAKALRGFETHGFQYQRQYGDQACGDCPFCGKEDHFFINLESLLWDCKVCSAAGNFSQYLEQISERNEERWDGDKSVRLKLARDRGLPVSSFREWRIGWDGRQYTVPVFDHKGQVIDLRRYQIGGKVLSTPTVKTGMLGLFRISDSDAGTVYVCEGEWDAIALDWLIKRNGASGKTVSVPGASTFKTDWVRHFNGKDVIACYDNDDAGEKGEDKLNARLDGVAKSIKYVKWPDETPKGFDVRDFVVDGLSELEDEATIWHNFALSIGDSRRSEHDEVGDTDQPGTDDAVAESATEEPCGKDELLLVFNEWLHLEGNDLLAAVFGAVLAGKIPGDPLWLFLVAPPGGTKSEILMSLTDCSDVELCSALTPHALVSGMNHAGGDPSLIPKLDGRVLIIKDFTTTLSMHPLARDEIFGQLRDAYDGKFDKTFGNGITRHYESTFGIIAGVTPTIDTFSTVQAGLGERFLKYRHQRKRPTASEERTLILRALGNVGDEVEMRKALRWVTKRFMKRKIDLDNLPAVSDENLEVIASMGMLVSRLRGVIDRDKYNPEMLHSRPSHEIGTRVSKQLKKMALGLALFNEVDAVGTDEMRLLFEIAMGTVSDKVEAVIITVALSEKSLSTNEVCTKSRGLTRVTTFRILEDLRMLEIVKQVGKSNAYRWKISSVVKRLMDKCRVS